MINYYKLTTCFAIGSTIGVVLGNYITYKNLKFVVDDNLIAKIMK
jgi:hypothetical protein